MDKKTKPTRASPRPKGKKVAVARKPSKNKKALVRRPVAAKKAAVARLKKTSLKVVKDIPSGGIPSQEVLDGVGVALGDALFLDYVAKNVGSQANEVLKELAKGPRKDDQLAETVNIKLNEVRRVLNLLNKHGIVRYDVKRDSSGWLTFEWHVDYVAFSDFYKTLEQRNGAPRNSLPENCNDFFVCGGCVKKQVGLVYPFDVAYEKSFKCDCGKSLEALTRSEAESYIRN